MDIAITKVLLTPILEKLPVAIREMTLRVTDDDMDTLDDIMEHYTGGNIPSSGIATELPTIVGLTDNPTRIADIDGGWGTKRYKVLIVSETRQNDDSDQVIYITGYTDSITDINEYVDPETVITFNHVLVTVSIDGGPVSLTGFYDMLHDSENSSDLYASRPIDVISGVETIVNDEFSPQEEHVLPISSIITDATTVSSSRNNLLYDSFTRVINSMDQAQRFTSTGDYTGDAYSKVKSIVMEQRPTRLPIIKELSKLYHTSMATSCTLQELEDISSVEVIPERAVGDFVNMDTELYGELFSNDAQTSTAEVSMEKSIATSFGIQASAKIEMTPITTISFSVSNFDGDIVLDVSDYDSIVDSLQMDVFVDQFLYAIETVIFNGVTRGGNILCDIICHIDIDTIRIGVDIGNGMDYTSLPKYTSSSYNPLATNYDEYNSIVSSYKELLITDEDII